MLSTDPINVHRRERYAAEPGYRKTIQARNRFANLTEMHRAAKNKFRANHPASRLIEGARARAKKRNLPFNITEADVVIPAVCPIDGLPLIRAAGLKGPNPRSPTLDCIIPERGYVRGNIAVISHHWNRLKCTMTVTDLRRLITYIEGRAL